MAAIAERRQVDVCRLLDADGGLVAAHDYNCFGATALLHAVWQNNREMIDLLLDRGADINQRSDWWAGSFGVLPCDDRALAMHLIERGATVDAHAAAGLDMIDELTAMIDDDPDVVHARGGDGQTPLHFAASARIVDLLLVRGADIEARCIDHESAPAQWALTRDVDVCRHLVGRGAAVDPFMLAGLGNVDRLQQVLEQDASLVNARVNEQTFPITGPEAGHIYFFTLGEGTTALHAAAKNDQAQSIRLLVAAGADPDARGGYDDASPLHLAAWENHVKAINALAESGAEIDLRSGKKHKNTPLGWAIVSGADNAVEALLALGAKIHRFHRKDAEAGLAGEFRQFTQRGPDAFQRIIDLLAAGR